jgi:hypothetical protein
MYLEFVLALELRERSSLDKIFPLMLGDKDDATGKYGRFTFRGSNPCYPTSWPEVAVESVDAKLRERLDDMELGMPLVDTMTVSEVLAGVMKYQGAYIEGDLEDALTNIIEKKIVYMRKAHDKAVQDALEAESKAANPTVPGRVSSKDRLFDLAASTNGADSKRDEGAAGSGQTTPRATPAAGPPDGSSDPHKRPDKGHVEWAPTVVGGGGVATSPQLDPASPATSAGFVSLKKSSRPTTPAREGAGAVPPGPKVTTKPVPTPAAAATTTTTTSLMDMFGFGIGGAKPVVVADNPRSKVQERGNSSIRVSASRVSNKDITSATFG